MLTPILYLFIALIPVLFYILVIWATTPWKAIDLRTAFQYFITGMMSVGILLVFFRLFPNWQDPVLMFGGSNVLLILAFLQVALVEEICKFISFRLGEGIRGKDQLNYDSSIGTMFYCGISAIGFAFIENVQYAIAYGGQVIIFRSITSMMVHFLCGLIMGYWLAASRVQSKLHNRSLMEVMFIKKPALKRISYSIMGISCAMILHGLFDYNIFSEGHIVSNYLIILGGLVAAYLASKDLIEREKV